MQKSQKKFAKLGIGQKGKAKVAIISLAETTKKTKETEAVSAEALLSEIRAIKVEVDSMK